MSYNYNNQYSPYYQPPQTSAQQQPRNSQQNEGGQYASNSRSAGSSSSNAYQPLSAYQSEHQRQLQQQQEQAQASGQASNGYPSIGYTGNPPYSTARYDNLGPTTTAEPAHMSSYPATARSSSIGYADGVPGQERSSLAQLIDYNRARGTTNYTTSSGLPSPGDRSSIQGMGQSNAPYSQDTRSSETGSHYQTAQGTLGYPRQGYNASHTGRSSPAQYQYSTSQQQPQNNRQNQYLPQSPRSNNGQTVPGPASRTSLNSNHSPPTSTNQHPQNPSSNAAPHHYTPSSIEQNRQTSYNQQSAQSSKGHPHPTGNPSHGQSTQRVQNPPPRPSSVTHQANGVPKTPTPSAEQSMPTTVNPTQVFNNAEYQRRLSEAGAAKKAGPAKKSKNTKSTLGSPPADDVTQAAKALVGPTSPNADAATKAQIEQEMKAMIEKMRDYKAKDPSLFSQVWEEVKKGTPTQTSSGQNAAKNNVTSPLVNGSGANHQAELPAEAELPASSPSQQSSFPEDFDRGRYPMARRKRGNAAYTPDRKPEKSGQKRGKKSGDEQDKVHAEQHVTALHERNDMAKQNGASRLDSSLPGSNTAPQVDRSTSSNNAQNGIQKSKPKPKSVPQGGTYWPENLKRALADAARTALVSAPQNTGRTITTDEIHEILNTNPSYYQLCEYLEQKGFVIDRSQFARLLLSTVPDMEAKKEASTSAPQSAPGPVPAPSHPQVARPPVGYMSPLNGGPGSTPGVKAERPQSIVFTGLPHQPPLSKQDKARKRDFSEIVDLSNLSDDDNELLRHGPRPRLEPSHPVPGPLPTPEEQRPASRWEQQWADRWGFQNREGPSTNFKPPNVPPIKPQPASYRNEKEGLLYDKVAEPINQRRDALRRSSYDVRTIARDILVSSGRHPTMGALNRHLDPLREHFISVDQNTDLSTFRWDLVDPGGPPGPVPRHQGRENGDVDDRGNNGAPTIAQPPVALPNRSASRRSGGVATATASDTPVMSVENKPQMPKRRGRPPKHKLSNVQPLGGSTNTRPTSFNPRGPGTQPSVIPGPRQPVNIAPQVPPMVSTPNQRPSVSHGGTPGSNQRPPAGTPTQAVSSTPTTNARTTSGDARPAQGTIMQFEASPRNPTPTSAGRVPGSDRPTGTPNKVPGRKGRPPGAKNKQPRSDKGIPKKQPPEGQSSSQATPTPAARSSPSIRETSIPTSSTPARQSGLRNVMTPSGSGLAVVIPSHSPSVADPGSARKGGDAAKADVEPSGRYPSPSFRDFTCRWQDCTAELQSMEVLRRHVLNTHRRGEGPWQCKWANCHDPDSKQLRGQQPGAGESHLPDGQHTRLKFEEKERWERHMERKHLGPYAKELADLGMDDDFESSDYMSDTSHRRAVPRAHPPRSSPHDHHPSSSTSNSTRARLSAYRHDPLPWNTDPKVAAEYHEAHNNDTDEQRRKAIVRALTAKKKAVGGPGVYKTGANTVGEGKRRVFMTSAGTQESNRLEEVEDERLQTWRWNEDDADEDEEEGDGRGGGSEEDFEKV